MSQYRAYPAYKDSGVEWIGQVPEHWKIAQIKRISALNPRKSTLSEEKDSLCTFLPMEKLRTNAVTLDETRPIHEVYGGYSYFCDGDILIAKVTPCFENGNIAVANGLVNGIGFGSTEINVLRVNGKGHNRFLYYRLQEEQFRTIAKSEMRGTGGLKRVPTDLFESFTIGLPDTDEQATIAATLDRETARIDTLVEKKTRFIELMKEKRQALITHAVTKGLDPNVKMKDSGVEWIGQVPEHWKVARVKRLVSLRNERRNDVSTDTIYIGLEDVEAGSGQYKPTNGSSRQSEDSTVGIFYEGDVLYGKLRPYLRKAIISEMAGCCSTEFLVLRAEKTEPRWLQEWLLTPDVTHQIESGCEGAKMPRADWGHIGSIEVVYPDQPEQAQILTTLDRETARIDALISKVEQSITLLKERRSAFITAAVTGQIDLRGKQ
ncbi:type I restriction modification DNA specificity domain protein [Escherichia coli 3-373-03_S4_C3]|uniref:restriction endonuclease subunit S n=1 Tax=Escherichia coli TaxID=562 RepID=UPI0004D9AA74|nr:restriction endonuclease subunit S [Escherichia coli]KDU32385.1 type I restriction modification DNA specificity domain protein [Escherichia coli 3-373-03_S4_C2]KDU50256.1 type I restriction modification DNA specificity domain protein [Escherichia coli 3-373-03_S4_C1]KEL20779.1 type I restriction modification DNA specificity domain protein [Escherichia coli 3-373-03_S4_C3]